MPFSVSPLVSTSLFVTTVLKHSFDRNTNPRPLTFLGMALPKQNRLLRENPEVLVGTPGRLWDLISSGHDYFANMRRLRYLVLDEADRMVEKGHYQELDQILGKLPPPLRAAFAKVPLKRAEARAVLV